MTQSALPRHAVIRFGPPPSDLRRRLIELVLGGTTTPTTGLRVELEHDEEVMPTVGMREPEIDERDRFVGVIETTECRVLRLAEVDDQFARYGGGGFINADDWRTTRERFWGGYLDDLRSRLADQALP